MIETQAVRRPRSSETDGPQMRVLVVAEDDVVRGMIDDFLTDLGHMVSPVKSLVDLPQALTQGAGAVDVVIVPLPARNEWARRLIHGVHRSYPKAALVAMTPQGSVISAREAVSCGVQAYLHMPVRLAELELILIRLAEKKSDSPALTEPYQSAQQGD